MYKVLARKWRPKTFSEVVGQQHVLRALINALDSKRLHHAYLFTGTRGVGKTTLARILAKCLNCETGISSSPCGKCDNCLEIDAGRFLDLIEVDAASRTRVEDTRELLENSQYVPAKGRYKIYLIDEVHMLSTHSFNALLKTLEEPPEHVKFLFATTDPQKLPITVLSRCLQFNLKLLPPDLIQDHLQAILVKENIADFESLALLKLAVAAKGSVRDALSLLDHAIAHGGGKVALKDVEEMLCSAEITQIFGLFEAILANDPSGLLGVIAELAETGVDFTNVIDAMLDVLQQITVMQLAPEVELAVWYDLTAVKKLAANLAKDEVQLYYQLILIGKRDLPLAIDAKHGFEMLMLRLLAFRPDSVAEITQADLPSAEKKIVGSNAIVSEKKNTQLGQPVLSKPTESVNEVLSKIKVTGTTQALIRHCKVLAITADTVELGVEKKQQALFGKLQQERLREAFSEYLGREIRVLMTVMSDLDTLAKKAQQVKDEKQAAIQQNIAKDKYLDEIINKFGATIVTENVDETGSELN